MKNTEQQINLRGSSCGSSVLPPFRISICSRGRDAVAAVCWISSQVKATVPLLQQSATHLKILQYLYIISYFKPVGEFFFFSWVGSCHCPGVLLVCSSLPPVPFGGLQVCLSSAPAVPSLPEVF